MKVSSATESALVIGPVMETCINFTGVFWGHIFYLFNSV